MMQILEIIFFVFLFILVYGHFIYPLMVFFLSVFIKKPVQKKEWFPQVTLVIPFYNEAELIEAKLENVKNIEYPEDKLQILFVSDGSPEEVIVLLEGERDKRLELIKLPDHQGKATALNEALREAKGEVIVFSDISGLMNPRAIKYIVESFNDGQVGAVLGLYRQSKKEGDLLYQSEEKYWDFEVDLKKRESFIWSTIGAHGALYAIRKELFEPLEKNIINDDFIIPARIALKGFRVVYEERSILVDFISTGIAQELKRRIRLAYGNWQQMFLLGKDFLKRPGFLLWQFISHKVIRTVQGVFIGYMILWCVLARGVVYDVFLALVGLLIVGGLLGILAERWKWLKFLNIFTFFLLVVWGQIVGSFYFFLKKEISW